MQNEKKTKVMETTTYTPVSPEEKRSWTSIAFIWMGNSVCVPALMVGGLISMGLPYGQSVLAMACGFGMVAIYMILIGTQGADLGMPTTAVFSRAFGERGAKVASGFIIAFCGISWFGMQTTVCATSFCSMLKTAGIDFPMALSVIIWGAAMLLTAVYGIKIIDILNKISVPALIIMLIWGLINALRNGAGEVVSNYVPAEPLTFMGGVTLAVSGLAIAAVQCSDYTRYCKSRRDTAISSVLGVIPVSVLTLAIGGMLAVSTGSYDLTMIFSNMGLPVIGLICLILATWTTNCGNAYSGGIAIVGMFNLKDNKRSLATFIAGILGIILALIGIIDFFTPFLNFISIFVPPMAGVVIADYWILGKGNKNTWKPFAGVNWLGLISWVCGTAFGMAFSFFVPTINAILVAMIVYLILIKVVKSKKLNPFCE